METQECAMAFAALWAPHFRVEFVMLVLQIESCFLPQEDDALPALPVGL